MSTLPQINPRRPSLSASLASIYQVYPAILPPAPDIPKKVNPAFPAPPVRTHTGYETVSGHWNNDIRSSRMKQREHYRYHNAWGKYYYGNTAEQESHRANIRAVLKQQMSDSDKLHRHQQVHKVLESRSAVETDAKDKRDDRDKFHRHFVEMRSYTQDNKSSMERQWDNTRNTKRLTDLYDREQLRYNPINWSCTLK